MEQLQKITVSASTCGTGPETACLELYRRDGAVERLYTLANNLRRALNASHCNVVSLEAADTVGSTLALVQGWPEAFRPAHITLSAVEPEDEVVVQSRVRLITLDELPPSEHPWVQLEGPLKNVLGELCIHAAQGEVLAADLVLPSGCRLRTPGDKVLHSIATWQVQTVG